MATEKNKVPQKAIQSAEVTEPQQQQSEAVPDMKTVESPEIATTVTEAAPVKAVISINKATPKPGDPYQALVTKYAKYYPKNTTFHITSDMQVFLSGDKSLALLHQRSLKNEEQVRTIKVQ